MKQHSLVNKTNLKNIYSLFTKTKKILYIK